MAMTKAESDTGEEPKAPARKKRGKRRAATKDGPAVAKAKPAESTAAKAEKKTVTDEKPSPADLEVAKEAFNALDALGWITSRKAKRPIDADGNPLPWITYPAIALLERRVKPNMNVFEFGSGFSTLWWSKRAQSVTAVEHHVGWYERIKGQVPDNATLHHVELQEDGEYCRAAAQSPEKPFHVIVIDGRDRVNCAKNAISALRPGGVIVWDNSDRKRYRPGTRHLVQNGFKRLPLVGFGPRLSRVWETSIFYRPDNCLGL